MNKQAQFNNRTYDLPEVVPGVLKFNSAYLVYDRAMNEWKYCNQARLDALSKKYKGLQNLGAKYESRSPGAARRALKKRLQPKPPEIPKIKKITQETTLDPNKITSTGRWIHKDYRFPGETFNGSPKHVLDGKSCEP